jgi:hypothetical protein
MKILLKNWTLIAFVTTICLLSSGCAFTVEKVNIAYRTPKEWPRQFEKKPEVGVTIGTFEDKRPVSTPIWLANKYNGYGKTSGGYEAEKPLAEILRDALISGLIEANYKVEKDPDRSVLTCNVLDYGTEFIQTGLFGSELRTRLQCEFTLVDNATKQVLWKEIIQGNALMAFGAGSKAKNQYPWRPGEKFGTSGAPNKEALRQITILSIDKVVMEVTKSEQFRRAVTR